MRWRRLVRGCEVRIDVSEGMTCVAMGAIMLRRLTTEPRSVPFSNGRAAHDIYERLLTDGLLWSLLLELRAASAPRIQAPWR